MVFLSNLIEEKGINNLLKAKKILKDKGVCFELKIAGNLISQNDIESLLNDDQITYLGNVNGTQKTQLLKWSNVLCLPTYYKMEGQPISIIEGMATGNAILTTNHAGITDICSEKNAVFCNKNDIFDLSEKIENLYQNPHIIKKLAYENFKHTSLEYTEKKFVENAIKIFERCMI